MTAIVRKTLTCLISKHTSSVCKSHVSFSLSLHFFSTSRERLVNNHTVFDILLYKHHFSPKVASLVASDLTRLKNPEKADSILSFLKESGFLTTQLEKIVKYRPRFLSAHLGFSSDDIAKIISSHPAILHMSVSNKIMPSLSVLKGLLGSNIDMAKLLKICAWFVTAGLENAMVPNVEFLKSCGIRMERILILLYNYPRKSVEKTKEMGVNRSSNMFIYAIGVIASMSNKTWELKWRALQNFGFSESDILTMFRKTPLLFTGSMEKIKKIKEVLLASGKFNMSCIVHNPTSFAYSIEQRYKLRLRILGILESRNLIKSWPSLGAIYMSDDEFFEKLISPYLNEIG
ncbi:hypothetical protein Pfo_028082 [Paulownia fortunei]|nr:hypothetical protein Pfo_028082 [Paulownia fortunei]